MCIRDRYITEDKFSGSPDFYSKKFALTSQLSTYFLSDPNIDYAIVKAVRAPGQRTGKGRYSGETPEDYSNRVYSDIISRPSYYFMGLNRMKKTYGRKFFRSEFPLDEMRTEHAQVTHEIKWAMRNNAYYRNYLACHVPTTCGFLPICETGVVSEEMFDMKPKDDIKKEEGCNGKQS